MTGYPKRWRKRVEVAMQQEHEAGERADSTIALTGEPPSGTASFPSPAPG